MLTRNEKVKKTMFQVWTSEEEKVWTSEEDKVTMAILKILEVQVATEGARSKSLKYLLFNSGAKHTIQTPKSTRRSPLFFCWLEKETH